MASSTGDEIPMPDFDYIPKSYKGLSIEKIQEIKKENIVPCIQPLYRKPLILQDGKMQWLFDDKGRRYLDMFGGIVTISVGHCHPKVTEALHDQTDTLWHTTNMYQHSTLYEYVDELIKKLPSYLQVVYVVNSGSEANDLALFLARLYTNNFEIISFRNCYHGMSPYMMGTTALSTWRYNVPVSFGVHHAMMPDVYNGIWGGKHCRHSLVQTTRHCDCCLYQCQAMLNYYKQLEEVFMYSVPRGHVAGIIAESIQGVGGIVQFPKGFLQKAYDLVKANGGVCIADEVQTGFGRTGEHFWGFEMHGIKPDIVTVAKGIANGFPMGAVITTKEIAEVLNYSSHFNTFGGNPLSCRVARTVLQVIEEDELQYNSKKVGDYLIKELAKLRDEFECVGDVRGKGLMIGVEFVQNKETKAPLSSKSFAGILEDCKDMGVLIGRGGFYGNVMRFTPPMCINIEDAKYAVSVVRKALKRFVPKSS